MLHLHFECISIRKYLDTLDEIFPISWRIWRMCQDLWDKNSFDSAGTKGVSGFDQNLMTRVCRFEVFAA